MHSAPPLTFPRAKASVKAVLCAFAVCASAGCTLLRSDWHPVSVSVPAAWQQTTVTASTAPSVQSAWWQSFGDRQLDALVQLVLVRNNDLASAAIRVRRAQLQADLADTNLVPDLTASGTYTHAKSLDGLGSQKSATTAFNASYELDLWGKLSAQRDAAKWEAVATEADREVAALSLVATTADLYWSLGSVNERIALSEASIDYAHRTLDLVVARYRAGAVSGLDLAQARQNLASQEANHTTLLQERVEDRNALAILLDQPPENGIDEPTTIPALPLPAVAAGIPAEVLGRRPDLRAAQGRLREDLANTDVARANFFPSIALTGSLGTSSPALHHLLANPIGTLGTSIVLPFIEWNTTRLKLRISETEYEEAVRRFRQSLYAALQEVENALSARTQLEAQAAKLEVSMSEAERAAQLSGVRYRAGATELQPWLDAQERSRNAQIALIQNRQARRVNLMALYKALGGAPPVVPGANAEAQSAPAPHPTFP